MFGGNINNIMKMAKQFQKEAKRIKADIEEKEFTGTAGGEAVKVVAKGNGEITSIDINPELLDGKNREMLQDLIVAASNQALKKGRDALENAMKDVTGGMGIDLGGLL